MKQISPKELINVFSQKPNQSSNFQLSPIINSVDYSDCDRVLAFIMQYPQHPLSQQIQNAITIIRRQFRQYSRLSLSFNGGKDATVLLHLVRTVCVIMSRFLQTEEPHTIFRRLVRVFVIHVEKQFPEISEFLIESEIKYNLGIHVYQGIDFKQNLQNFIDDFSPEICFVGVRKGDPTSKGVIQQASPGWPQVVRCSALYDFEFLDVFDFLLRFNYKYCELYNKGFTSIGGIENSYQNEKLTGRDIKELVKSGQNDRVVDQLLDRGISVEKIEEQYIDDLSQPAFFVSRLEINERGQRNNK
ncbi:FAD synthetase [Spironucleus salmonicida]|uniref:FAD synthase n=1 Tax=Spironucleus salmonicida TaxID=348837 RepID=V6LRR3_9EUKA|nr:FAD synthetase [Spironucleus salmonicida]|eukprot:EST43474.1 Phosphoadenosine phosphosulfate reductase family protein [Spironucleus salmonicida]